MGLFDGYRVIAHCMDVGFKLDPCIPVRHSDFTSEKVWWLIAKGELNEYLSFRIYPLTLEHCIHTSYNMSEEPLKPFKHS